MQPLPTLFCRKKRSSFCSARCICRWDAWITRIFLKKRCDMNMNWTFSFISENQTTTEFRRERCVLLQLEGRKVEWHLGATAVQHWVQVPKWKQVEGASTICGNVLGAGVWSDASGRGTRSVNHLIIKDRFLLLTLECSLEDKWSLLITSQSTCIQLTYFTTAINFVGVRKSTTM